MRGVEKSLLKGYKELDLAGSPGYVKESVINSLDKVGAIIFDCDGVLIDSRNSYTKAIGKTVAYILSQLTLQKIPPDVVPTRLVYALRRSGGFNNDWDTTHAILLQTLTSLPPEPSSEFIRFVRLLRGDKLRNLKRRFEVAKGVIASSVDRELAKKLRGKIFPDLEHKAATLKSTGVRSLKKALLTRGASTDTLKVVKATDRFLSHPGPMKDNLLSTIFDEFFYGKELFTKRNGTELRFNKSSGLINDEEVIVKRETLDRLREIVGEDRLGIASGRSFEAARYTLKAIMDCFNTDAVVFIEDEERKLSSTADRSRIWKPEPYSLKKALQDLDGYEKAVYVGDSAEDYIMARRTVPLRRSVIFVGVYNHTYSPTDTRRNYLKGGADFVLPTVNELPQALKLSRDNQA